ncbi:MAG: SpoIID/LytB domain-containing protein, partial [Clostridia bacterium]|nr:SpoIID/LytB domain-containing protein [Clostridia bacterium]
AAYRTGLKKNASSGNYVPSDDGQPEIGPYHVRLLVEDESYLLDYIPVIKSAFSGVPVFRAFENGSDSIMLGSFADVNGAEAFRAALIEKYTPEPEETDEETSYAVSDDTTALPDETETDDIPDSSVVTDVFGPDSDTGSDIYEESESGEASDSSFTAETTESGPDPFIVSVLSCTVSEPTDDSVYLITDSGEIEFLCDLPDSNLSLAVKAVPLDDGTTFINTFRSAGTRKYDGTLEFKSIKGDGYFGIRIVDVLPLDTYAAGVIPYEISSSWPLETQKAFAVAVKSYALTRRGAHASSGADLCCTTHCQVYKGFASTNSRVWQAVNEVRGLIGVASNGRICNCYYSSSTGGCTANVNEVWSGSLTTYPYLRAAATPWEKYNSHNKAHWTVEYTPEALYKRLSSKGYALKSNVKSVEITLGNNTSYVKSVKVTDTKGNSVTINKSTIPSALGLNSGNFVVGKSGETVSRRNFVMLGFNAVNSEPTIGVGVITNPFDYLVTGRQSFFVLTSGGLKTFSDSNEEKVATGDGVFDFSMSQSLDSSYYPTITGVGGQIIPDIKKMTATEEDEQLLLEGADGNFVFVGRGWGHGLGMSQFGAYDMGVLGYDYETIFTSYYTDAVIMDYDEYIASKQ